MRSRLFFMYLHEASRFHLEQQYILFKSSLIPYQSKADIKRLFKSFDDVLSDKKPSNIVNNDFDKLKSGITGFKHGCYSRSRR